jgi:hypothetical protein
VEETLRQWFDSDETPADFYQLLGKPRLDPSRDDLLHAVRAAYRALHSFENHAVASRLPRARVLQKMIVEAEHVFAADAEWQAYNESLAARLRAQYVAGAGRDASTWRLENLRLWLERTQNVHPSRVDELVTSFLSRRESADAERTMASGVLETLKEPPTNAKVDPSRPGAAGTAPDPARPPTQSPRGAPRPGRRADHLRAGAGAAQSDAAMPVSTPVAPARRAPPRPAVPGGRERRAGHDSQETPLASGSRGIMPSRPAAPSHPVLPATSQRGSERSAETADALLAARALKNLLWMLAAAIVTAVVLGGVGIAIVLSRR